MLHHIEKLKTFTQVVDYGSFAAVGRLLGISAAAVGKQIRCLEEALSVQLLFRSTRELGLTNAGEEVYKQAKKIIHDIEICQENIKNLHHGPQGPLHIASPVDFGRMYVIPFVAEFSLSYPAINIHLSLADRRPDLFKEKVDIFVGITKVINEDYRQRKIMDIRQGLFASPLYLEKWGTPQRVEDLKHHSLISHTTRLSQNILFFGRGVTFPYDPFMTVDSTVSLVELAALGLGIVQLHTYSAYQAVQEGKLVEILTEFQEPPLPLYLVFPQEKYKLHRTNLFINSYMNWIKDKRIYPA